MKSRIGRAIGAVAIGSLLAVSTSGMAAASETGGGSGTASTEAAGAHVLQLRDQLTKKAYAGDLAATRATMAELAPMLDELAVGKRYALSSEAQQVALRAAKRADEVRAALAHPQQAPRQLPAPPGMPPLPSPLTLLSALLQSLLMKVTSLVGSLLGSAPPLPVPDTPQVPGTPGLPAPAPLPAG